MESPHSPQSNRQPDTHRQSGLVALALMAIVRFYRYFISPMFAPSCRFNPTCSRYALQALQQHGAIYGTWLTLKRIARCHPLSEGGDDPVPPAKSAKDRSDPTA